MRATAASVRSELEPDLEKHSVLNGRQIKAAAMVWFVTVNPHATEAHIVLEIK